MCRRRSTQRCAANWVSSDPKPTVVYQHPTPIYRNLFVQSAATCAWTTANAEADGLPESPRRVHQRPPAWREVGLAEKCQEGAPGHQSREVAIASSKPRIGRDAAGCQIFNGPLTTDQPRSEERRIGKEC